MKRTQTDMLLDHLRINGPRGVTALDAFDWGCMRLAARVADLKASGHDIRTERVPGRSHVRYVLVEHPTQMRWGVAS